jgi:hypothetical protein
METCVKMALTEFINDRIHIIVVSERVGKFAECNLEKRLIYTFFRTAQSINLACHFVSVYNNMEIVFRAIHFESVLTKGLHFLVITLPVHLQVIMKVLEALFTSLNVHLFIGSDIF